jgi:steroid 5-alpha reductase family enzyme
MIAAAASGLGLVLVIAVATWAVSLAKRDASIVDGVWSLMIFGAGLAYAGAVMSPGPRAAWVLALAGLWAARLSIYIIWRNAGEPEDRRYRAIRSRNEPGFALKSLYLVFLLQAVLAWIVSAPLAAAIAAPTAEGWLDAVGAALVLFGIAFESMADWQVARWRARRPAPGTVLDSGLWRYSRHPNYFGEFCVWWGFGLVAVSAGAWWALVSPLLMTLLLLRVSGVALLEKDLSARKPAYREYMQRTSAFFPGPRRSAP